jgi:hypothetical protein
MTLLYAHSKVFVGRLVGVGVSPWRPAHVGHAMSTRVLWALTLAVPSALYAGALPVPVQPIELQGPVNRWRSVPERKCFWPGANVLKTPL